MALFSRENFSYQPLTQKRKSPVRFPVIQVILSILVIAIAAGTGFYAGRLLETDYYQVTVRLPSHPVTFRYNRLFGEAPSNASDAAWAGLFPTQGGFFKHPQIAPQRSALSVFHQLHCLDGIRHGYWVIHEAATTGTKISEEDLPFMSSPPHIRHCIDLLRHSLMCNPDLTVELKEEELGGVRGFGTEHMCKDWDALLKWTEEWEDWEQDPRSEEKEGDK